jgi:hypothetical protein
VRRDEEQEQENESGRKPDEELFAPHTRKSAVEFGIEFGAHSSASAFDADNRQRSI